MSTTAAALEATSVLHSVVFESLVEALMADMAEEKTEVLRAEFAC